MEKTKPNTTKGLIRQSKEIYYKTKYTQKKLKPGLVAFYDIRPGNGAGLFSQEKIREEIRGSPEKQSLTKPE